MALDSFQKRGSAMLLGMPGRTWLASPAGSLAQLSRQSVLLLCSTPLFTSPSADPIPVTITMSIDKGSATFAIDKDSAVFAIDKRSATFTIDLVT